MRYTGKAILVLVMLFAEWVHATPAAYWHFENSGASEYSSPAVNLLPGSGQSYSSNVPAPYTTNGVNGAVKKNSAALSNATGCQKSTTGGITPINSAMDGRYHGFTVEAFMYVPNGETMSWNIIIGSSGTTDYWYFGTQGEGKLCFGAIEGTGGTEITTLSASGLTTGEWHHVAAVGVWTQSGPGTPAYTMVQLYVDYAATGSAGRYDAASVGGPCIKINTTSYAVGRDHNWLLDELRISSVPLGVNQFLRAEAEPSATTCDDVWQLGNGIDADFNRDCYVDFSDMTVLAEDWLYCNDPENISCNWR